MLYRGHRGCDRMVVGFKLPMQSVPITTNIVSLNPTHGEIYEIQHYVIKFVSDLRQVKMIENAISSSVLSAL
jgi:hypothetical protein